MTADPILDALFEGSEYEQEEFQNDEYGKGDWPKAVLRDVVVKEATEKGPRQIALTLNLKGDEGEMGFTIFADTPVRPESNGDDEAFAKATQRYSISLNRIKSYVHAAGKFVTNNEKGKAVKSWPKGFDSFGEGSTNDDANFDKLVQLFNHCKDGPMPIRVKYRTYAGRDGQERKAKNVWGYTPKR